MNNCNILKRLLTDEAHQKKYKKLKNSLAYKRYIPKSLNKEDKCKQIISIIKGKKRPNIENYKNKKSKWTLIAKKYFNGNTNIENIAETLKIDKKGLEEIKNKAVGAYYSSGSRPNQTAYSWGMARIYSVLFGGPSRDIDKKIVEKYNIPLLKSTLLKGKGKLEPEIKKILNIKKYNNNEIDEIINLISFNKKNVEILGSFQLRSQLYFSDIDMFENNVHISLQDIKTKYINIIKKMLDDNTYYIGDIKIGIAEHLRVINEDNYNYDESKNKLKLLKKYFKSNEYNFLNNLLIKNPNIEQLNKIKKHLRLHILRWKPREILKGEKKLLDGTKISLINSITTNSIFKMDFYKYFNNNNFLEFSIIYDIRDYKTGLKINNVNYNTKESLEKDIIKYTYEKEYFKVLKRRFSLLRYEYVFEKKKENKEKLIILNKLLNSNLGNLYQAKALLDNLIFLIENFNDLDKERISKSLDNIIYKLSFINIKKYLEKENNIINTLKNILIKKNIENVAEILNRIYEKIQNILNNEAKKYIHLVS